MKYCTQGHGQFPDNFMTCPTCNTPLASYPTTKFCTHCGNQVDAKAAICTRCGFSFDMTDHTKASGAMIAIIVFFPLVGLILAAVQWSDKPVAARTYLKAAIISYAVRVLLAIIWYVFLFLLSMGAILADDTVEYSRYGHAALTSLLQGWIH